MTREPGFWRSRTSAARLSATVLAPLAALYDAAQRIRWTAACPVATKTPVICIGNATLGGAGKTPFAVLLGRMLESAGYKTCFITRGYRGRMPGPLQVNPREHTARDVGDEALLLCSHGKTIVSRQRTNGIEKASREGADAIIMDDGFQNPSFEKALSILLVDNQDPDGNGCIFPAGPLREPLERACRRADIVVSVHRTESRKKNGKFHADYHAWLSPAAGPESQKVTAFAGIGIPEKFFHMLAGEGFELADTIPFGDHHFFSRKELRMLVDMAEKKNARLITTQKDHVRIPEDIRKDILAYPVEMKIDDAPSFIKKTEYAIANYTKKG